MQHAIECNNLFKRYESGAKAVAAVNGLDLEVRVGECFGLLGPNGAGLSGRMLEAKDHHPDQKSDPSDPQGCGNI